MMENVELGKSGVMVSLLGIGTWAWGDRLLWGYGWGYGERELHQAFDESLRAGITFFDTAEVYGLGKSEKFIGKFLRAASRDQKSSLEAGVQIATKFFPMPWRLTNGQLGDALRGSLKRLGVPRVDLYQIHFPVPPISIETWMDAMADAVEKGLTRAVGVSNYNAAQVRRAHKRLVQRGIPLASNQIEYSLLERRPDFDGVTQTCRELGVSVIAYSPLKLGILSGKYSPSHPPPGARAGRFPHAYLTQIQPLLVVLRDLGEKYGGKTPAQLALNWVMQHGAIPIPGAKNARQAHENAGALGWAISADDVALLDEISVHVV